MKTAEQYRKAFHNKTDSQIIESLGNEVRDKVSTIQALLTHIDRKDEMILEAKQLSPTTVKEPSGWIENGVFLINNSSEIRKHCESMKYQPVYFTPATVKVTDEEILIESIVWNEDFKRSHGGFGEMAFSEGAKWMRDKLKSEVSKTDAIEFAEWIVKQPKLTESYSEGIWIILEDDDDIKERLSSKQLYTLFLQSNTK